MERKEIKFEVEHRDSPTPSRDEVLTELASELESSEDLIIIEKLATLHGRQTASGIARLYESEEKLKELEPEYLSKRTEKSAAEKEETEEKEEEKEDEEEEAESEQESEEKPAEESEESEETEEKEEEPE